MTRLRSWIVLAAVVQVGCGTETTPEHADPQPQRPEFERIAARLTEGSNEYLGTAQIGTLRRRLKHGGLTDREVVQCRLQLTRELLRCGYVDEAAEEVETAFAQMSDEAKTRDPNVARLRGLVHLRRAEVQNCVTRHNADCCIFPLADGGLHDLPEPARLARESFEQALDRRPDDLALRWLLNIVGMALGDYPEGVPERYRIPAEAFRSQAPVSRFRDIAPDLGVDTFNLCGGAIVDDFDNDGALDIVTSTFDPSGPLRFYLSDVGRGFTDASAESRLDDQLGGLNCLGADYDNDGDVDVLVLRGAWLQDDGRIRNSLVRNNGDGTFTDVTRSAGLAEPAYPTQAAAWGDFDNDGDLDLYIGNESRKHHANNPVDYPGQLFSNNGDGTFTDIATAAGVTNDRYCKGVTAGDYDNDGDLDLYVSNIGRNRLYRNDGDGSFTDVARAAGVVQPRGRSFATWFFDYDNDGWLDLFVGAYDATIADIAADYLDREQDATAPCLYRNNGDGTFTDVAARMGLDHPYLPMGANFGDMDNDGFLDIYLATGEPAFTALMPNVMLRNDRGTAFQDVTTSAGLGHLQKGHGVAFADIDNDGDQDIYHQLGGFYPGDRFQNALFENAGNDNGFLVVKLVGVESNRAGYGARVRVSVETPGGPRAIHRAVGSVSSFGGSPSRLEIGLGDATAITRLEVVWPRSGARQTFTGVPLDAAILVREGATKFEPMPYEPLELLHHLTRTPSDAQHGS